ncbi:GntR family transcriptional regulator [Mycobacterium sp. 155]|uniref:GntR family transcriptional regulator n=1 Tax=Mycobacterium sp. 155 TaxID=1157943 RepID=UPI00037100F7|nr:GntR family transcriptional regulator [Mycobacterium sp. 155]
MRSDDGSRNGSIQSRLIAEVRRRIIAGEIAPGVNISELALAEEFGVSRTPVRETFKQLQTEGLIEIRPRVGTFVTIPSRREILELFEMKELLEGAAARLLAQRGRVPEVDRLEENLRQFDQAVASDDRARYVELIDEFHNLLIVGADNAKLESHYRTLMNQLAYSRLVTTSLSQPGRPLQSNREHRQVFELILAKDGDTAERVMREHVRASRQALLAGLDQGSTVSRGRRHAV